MKGCLEANIQRARLLDSIDQAMNDHGSAREDGSNLIIRQRTGNKNDVPHYVPVMHDICDLKKF
jgi:hypothetical protein